MKILIPLALLFATSALAAELDAKQSKRAYFSRQAGFFTRAQLSIDGKLYETSFWQDKFEISEAVKSNTQALNSIQQYDQRMSRSSLYLWGGLGLALTYLFSVDDDNYNPTIYWGIFGAGLGMSFYERGEANKHLIRTINIYNGEF